LAAKLIFMYKSRNWFEKGFTEAELANNSACQVVPALDSRPGVPGSSPGEGTNLEPVQGDILGQGAYSQVLRPAKPVIHASPMD
jgi:hypothetical protein